MNPSFQSPDLIAMIVAILPGKLVNVLSYKGKINEDAPGTVVSVRDTWSKPLKFKSCRGRSTERSRYIIQVRHANGRLRNYYHNYVKLELKDDLDPKCPDNPDSSNDVKTGNEGDQQQRENLLSAEEG